MCSANRNSQDTTPPPPSIERYTPKVIALARDFRSAQKQNTLNQVGMTKQCLPSTHITQDWSAHYWSNVHWRQCACALEAMWIPRIGHKKKAAESSRERIQAHFGAREISGMGEESQPASTKGLEAATHGQVVL
jgi:hypothetical protein